MPTLDWLWSYSLGSAVRGLTLAREAELLLVRLDDESLALLTTRGDLQARTRLPNVIAATISDDGSAIIAVGTSGQVWRLAHDLSIDREGAMPGQAIAVATDHFGQYQAVSDRQSNLHIMDRSGHALGHVQCPRPIRHLAFAPTTPHLVAASDFGWAGCLELGTAQWIWSDRPVSNIGSLAVAERDEPVLLGCFSEGIRCYGSNGKARTTWSLPAPCGLVSLSFVGESGVAAGVGPQLYGFDARGEVTFIHELEKPPTVVALAALSDSLFVGDGDGSLKALRLETPKSKEL